MKEEKLTNKKGNSNSAFFEIGRLNLLSPSLPSSPLPLPLLRLFLIAPSIELFPLLSTTASIAGATLRLILIYVILPLSDESEVLLVTPLMRLLELDAGMKMIIN